MQEEQPGNHPLYKFYGDAGDALVYLPTLQKLMMTTRSSADKMPSFVSSEQNELPCRTRLTFPPKFDVVDLHLANRCNMNCIYCYSDSNTIQGALTKPQIQCVIDYLMETASAGKVRVHFLGGEPAVAWDTLQYTVRYAMESAASKNKEVYFTVTSNGVWRDEQYDYFVSHFSDINISFDGIPEVQNAQRPLRSGKPSFDSVFSTVKRLSLEKAINLKIKTLISSISVNKMVDTMRVFCEAFPGIEVQFEPLHEIGARVSDSGVRAPSVHAFLEAFFKCRKLADEMGATNKIMTSFLRGLEYRPAASFCGCSGDNFIVTSHGLITSCDEVTRMDQKGADTFIFGEVRDGRVSFSKEKYQGLSLLSADSVEKCRNCFALYICRGGCPLSKVSHAKDFWAKANPDCDTIRDCIVKYLWYIAGKASNRSNWVNMHDEKTQDL